MAKTFSFMGLDGQVTEVALPEDGLTLQRVIDQYAPGLLVAVELIQQTVDGRTFPERVDAPSFGSYLLEGGELVKLVPAGHGGFKLIILKATQV